MNRETIKNANLKAVSEIMKADPVWVDVRPAIEVIPGMTEKLILHAGPPIEWERMSGPLKGAIAGALMIEGYAQTVEEAYEIAASGEFKFDACHNHSSVGPMAGVISASMPVFVIYNKVHGNYTYCNLNEGRGKVLRYGGLGEEVTERMKWMGNVLGPALQRAIRHHGEMRVKPILSEALQMGDDLHNRYKAASALFANRIASDIFATANSTEEAIEVFDFIAGNDYTFLNIAMPALKAMADSGLGVEYSTVVTTMCRNGTDFGIRVSSLPDQWFTAPAPPVKALYFPGYSEKDANPDIGDSAITETMGFGGFSAAASPSVVQFVGGTPKEAVERNLEMYEITTVENPDFTIPALEFRGNPLGIDILKVVETGTVPAIHTGVAHKEAGVGQIGAGCLHAPMQIFAEALESFAKKYSEEV